METNRLYDHRSAANYLGIHPRTLEHRVMRGLIEPLRMVNNDRVYTKKSLDELRERLEISIGEFSLQEIARMYSVSYFSVYRAFKERRKVVPARILGRIALYSKEQIELIAGLEEWKLSE